MIEGEWMVKRYGRDDEIATYLCAAGGFAHRSTAQKFDHDEAADEARWARDLERAFWPGRERKIVIVRVKS